MPAGGTNELKWVAKAEASKDLCLEMNTKPPDLIYVFGVIVL